MRPTIFVQIAAYRDPEILPTITDAIAQAEYPDRISIGLCWQYLPGVDEHLLPAIDLPRQVRLISIDSQESKGVCWARSMVQSLYQGEDYTLSIDSHMRFEPGWDTLLIDELSRCSSPKPVLSTYPPAYTKEGGMNQEDCQTVMVVQQMDDGVPRFRTLLLPDPPEQPPRGLFVAGGFHFASGKIINEVPYDPYLYFGQEEIALSLRLWTLGYDVFSPTRHAVYHLYYAEAAERRLHWHDRQTVALNQQGVARFLHFVGVKHSDDPVVLRDLGNYALGMLRTVGEFTQKSGIRFGEITSEPMAYSGEFLFRLNPTMLLTLSTA